MTGFEIIAFVLIAFASTVTSLGVSSFFVVRR